MIWQLNSGKVWKCKAEKMNNGTVDQWDGLTVDQGNRLTELNKETLKKKKIIWYMRYMQTKNSLPLRQLNRGIVNKLIVEEWHLEGYQSWPVHKLENLSIKHLYNREDEKRHSEAT